MSLLKTDRSAPPQAPKTKTREWADSLIFAIVAATLIRWATFEAYTIPSPSMEHSLLVGDYLFVSKLHYGTITPQTPLQVPAHPPDGPDLGHGPEKLLRPDSAAHVPASRASRSIQRNDVVVFHVPFESSNTRPTCAPTTSSAAWP